SAELPSQRGGPHNSLGAEWATRMVNVMGLLAQGRADLGFIGGAEVDRYGNLNTSRIGDWQRPTVKLPGSGGGADIASLAGRLAVILAHDKRRFRDRVDFITSEGYGEGGDWRKQVGLPRGGPSAVITTLGVLGFEAETGEAMLRSYHPFTTVEEVQANTGWALRLAPELAPTPAPTADELRIIREC